MTFEDLNFKPHPWKVHGVTGIAKYRGCSIIYGPAINGYEVKDTEGDVHSGFTILTLEEYFNKEE